MPNNARDRGLKFEREIRDYLRSLGLPVERIPPGMREDRGDLSGLADVCVEIKAYKDTSRAIREGLAELEVEQANAGAAYGLVVVKRRGVADPGRQLVIQELWQAVALLQRCPELPRSPVAHQ